MPRSAFALAAVAALMGAAGVALAAISAHQDGGDLGRLASEFLILHAAALVGISAHAPRAPRALIFAGGGLALGTLVFAGDLTMRAFAGHRLFPFAAPSGGSLMIVSWLALALTFAAGMRSRG